MAAFVLTAGMVASATGGRLVAGAPERVFDTVSTDSRAIGAEALFIALRGERFDGHAFVSDVIAHGAAGVLVSAAPADSGGTAVIVVPDTLAALQALAHEVRRRARSRVVAITGSAGKTTTKELTADLLSARYRVFRNQGNLNNHIGLPLSLLELRRGPEMAVVELGMNHPGEIRRLVEIAAPDVRVWTNVGDAHLGFFGSREAIADAKAEILEQASRDTLAVANGDDPLVMARLAGFPGRRLTFGERDGVDVRASAVVDRGLDGSSADVVTPQGPLHVTLPLPGRIQLLNALAAIAVVADAGVSTTDIESRLARVHPVARRGATRTTTSGVRIVDDSYNASPAAMRSMLAALAVTPTSGRRIAVLGEMLELGDGAAALHEACGRAAAEARIDELVVIGGPAADGLVSGARQAGLASSRIHRFADSREAAAMMPLLVQAGDLVLVKGSRGTRTDVVADELAEVA